MNGSRIHYSAIGARTSRAPLCVGIGVLLLLLPLRPAPGADERPQPLRATGFELSYGEGYRIVTVHRPYPGADEPREYLLLERGQAPPERYRALPRIEIPVERAITTASPLLAQFELLGAPDRVVGHDRAARIYSEVFRERSAEGKLHDVGEPPHMNLERVISLEPDVVLINSLGAHGETEHKLQEAGLPVLVAGDWLEDDPVGRAEWLLVAAVLLQREAQAAHYLDGLRGRYDALRAVAARRIGDEKGPAVVVNAPFQGVWSVPGGASYMARLLADAGAHYPWAEQERRGALHLELESVLARAADADIWLNPGAAESLAAMLRIDPRLAVFAPLETGRVYNFTARTRHGGANDYFERGALEPDVVLADLIRIVHPHLLPDHELRYFQRLR